MCMVNFYICWMYAIGMPVMPIIGAMSFYVSYWVDKFMFCNFFTQTRWERRARGS